jgi:co-chaperonin GroES (HSP10)
MASFEPAKVLEYSDGEDPKKVVGTALGDALDHIQILQNQILLVTAPHKTKSSGGIIFVDKTKEEERYQGKTGLIVALGETAFDDDQRWPSNESRPKVGDWVIFRNSDTSECSINGISCRFILDVYVRGTVDAPDVIR